MFFSVVLNVLVLVGVALYISSSCTSYVYLYLLGVAVAVGVSIPLRCSCTSYV
jgi:hypothetical protein